MIQNILCAIFAIILLVFSAIFIDDPCLCFDYICNASNLASPYDSYHLGCTRETYRKAPLLKTLVACAAAMVLSNIFFIVVYVIAYAKARSKPATTYQVQQPEADSYQIVDDARLPYLAPAISEPHYYAPAVESAPASEIPSTPFQIRTMKL